MLLSYSYCLESREGISDILRIHWSAASNNITSWERLGNKVSDKSAWWVALRNQSFPSVTFRKNTSRRAVSGNNRLWQQTQGHSSWAHRGYRIFASTLRLFNNFSHHTLILNYHRQVNSTHSLHFTIIWKEWWERRGIPSGIRSEKKSVWQVSWEFHSSGKFLFEVHLKYMYIKIFFFQKSVVKRWDFSVKLCCEVTGLSPTIKILQRPSL